MRHRALLVLAGVGLFACGTPKAPPPPPSPAATAPHGHGHHGQGFHHRFDGAEGWAKVFDLSLIHI